MGIFSRLGTLIKSNLNDLISKAEDPEKILNQLLVDMKTQLIEAKKQVALAIGDEKRLRKQWEDQKNNMGDWERKAMIAVQAGDDELAKEALMRHREYEEMCLQFEQQWMVQKGAVDKLKDQLQNLNNKIEEAKRKRNLLIAKKKRAEAQKAIQETMAGLSDTSAFDTFDRMAEHIERIEAEAAASQEIAELGSLDGDTLTQKFKALESSKGKGGPADMALIELKAKMGLLPSSGTTDPKALPQSKSTEESQKIKLLDAEISSPEKTNP